MEKIELKKDEAYHFTPLGNIVDAPYVPRGIHRVAEVELGESGSIFFQVAGSERWQIAQMFNIQEIDGKW